MDDSAQQQSGVNALLGNGGTTASCDKPWCEEYSTWKVTVRDLDRVEVGCVVFGAKPALFAGQGCELAEPVACRPLG